MLLALKNTNASDAGFVQRLWSRLIKIRLSSDYSHGGVVIDGTLYHTTSLKGSEKLEAGEWNPDHWHMLDIGGDDAAAIERFNQLLQQPKGRVKAWIWKLLKGYDWFSLMAFVGVKARVSWLKYCFETCWFLRYGENPGFKVTPERLLARSLLDFQLNSGKFVERKA